MKSIRFDIGMKDKKIIIGLFIIIFLGACSSPTAMIGPVYTLSSTGSGLQAGINYGSDQLIRQYTGKSPMENLQKISSDQNNKTKNIQKETLESEDFYFLVKNKIEKTGSLLNLTNQ